LENTPASIRAFFEPDSRVTVEREAHFAKHCRPIVSTEEGTQIDASDGQSENASKPIRDNSEPDSKVTFEGICRDRNTPRQVFPLMEECRLKK
jgi:hypothetical protein